MARYTIFQASTDADMISLMMTFRERDTIMASRSATYRPAITSEIDLPAGHLRPEVLDKAKSSIFARHQDNPGERSMSKGDVLQIDGVGVFLCCAFGWEEIGGFEADRFHDAADTRSLAKPATEQWEASRARLREIGERMRARYAVDR